MRIIIFIISFLLSFSCFSQRFLPQNQASKPKEEVKSDTIKPVPKWDPSTQTEEYVMVLAQGKFLSSKVIIRLDYGQAYNRWKDDIRVKDSTGYVINFNSIIDALNYMNSTGWEFVNAYAITIGSQNVYHYLMRREKNKTK